MINIDKPWSSLGFWSTPMFGPIQFLFIAREFMKSLNWIRRVLIHELPWPWLMTLMTSWAASLLVFSSLMAACWACLIFFPGRNGLAPNIPKLKNHSHSPVGDKCQGSIISKVTLFVGTTGSQRLQPTQTPGMMDDLTGWHSLSGRWAWSISQILLRDTILSFTRHWLSCPST